jgi:hypothetical protein
MTMQAALWTGAGAAVGTAVAAGVMEWRRSRRRDFDAVGWMPWRGIQVTALFAALALAVLAMRS